MSIDKCIRPPCFNRQLDSILNKFKLSKDDVEKELSSLQENPSRGNQIPGLNPLFVYKYRIGLKAYNIGKRSGLRVIYLVLDNSVMILIAVYYKGDYTSESKMQEMIRNHLKEVLASINQQ